MCVLQHGSHHAEAGEGPHLYISMGYSSPDASASGAILPHNRHLLLYTRKGEIMPTCNFRARPYFGGLPMCGEEYLPSSIGRLRNCVFRKMEPRALIEEIQVDGAAQCFCRGKGSVHCESIVMRPFNTFGTIYGQFECLFGRATPPCLWDAPCAPTTAVQQK